MLDELSSIPGLEAKHLRALARRQVTDLRSLASADPRVLYNAMATFKPRPTHAQISRWQAVAKSRLEEAAVDVSEWHTAASFAVVFAQRLVGDSWERRVEAERTEVEPERDREVWPGWECEPLCGWMLGQLAQADAEAMAARPAVPEAVPPPAAEPAAGHAPARAQLRIDSAAISDAARTTDVVRGVRWSQTCTLSWSRRYGSWRRSAARNPGRRCTWWRASFAGTDQAGIPRIPWFSGVPAGPSLTCPKSPPANTSWP